MVASFFQRCFGCQSGNEDAAYHARDVVELPVLDNAHSDRGQVEELLSTLREPLLSLEGSWFTRMRRLLDVLQERASLRATLIGIVRNESQPDPACYILLENATNRVDETSLQGGLYPAVDREAAMVILQACVSKMSVPASAGRHAACVPLLHGSDAVGALWLTVDAQPRPWGKARAIGSVTGTHGGGAPKARGGGASSSALASGCSVASTWPSYSGPPPSTAFAAALLSNGPSLDTLAFAISVAVQGADPDQLPWLAAVIHRLAAAASLHTLAGELCDCLAAHVQRRFVLEAAVRAVLVPGDGASEAAAAAAAAGGNGSGSGSASAVGFLLGATAPAAGASSPLPQSAASSRCVSRGPGNGGSYNGAALMDAPVITGLGGETQAPGAADGHQQLQQLQSPRQGSLGASSAGPWPRGQSGLGPKGEPNARRLSLLAATSQSGGVPRVDPAAGQVRASAISSGPSGQQQQSPSQPQPQLPAGLRPSLSLQQLIFQQQQQQQAGPAGPGPPPGAVQGPGAGRGLASFLRRRPHSVKNVATVEPVAVAVAGGAATGGDMAVSRRTLSGTTTTARPLVVALPLGADPPVAAAAVSAAVTAAAAARVVDTRASKSANSVNTCTNINSFLAGAGGSPPNANANVSANVNALMSSWQGGILPPPAATVTAHTFPLQHTLLQACAAAAAAASAVRVSIAGESNVHPAVVEDCCSLLQDVHRPCRDVCLLMGIMAQQGQQGQQPSVSASTPLPLWAAGPPLQRTSSQAQLHLFGLAGAGGGGGGGGAQMRAAAGAAWGLGAIPKLGQLYGSSAGPSASNARGGAGGGLRSLAVVLVPAQQQPQQQQQQQGGAAVEGPEDAPGSSYSSPCYLGLYVCFPARLPRPLLEAVRASCQELVDEALCRVVAARMCGDLEPEVEVYKGAAPGVSYAVLRGQELLPDEVPSPSPGPAVAPALAAAFATTGGGGGRSTPSRLRGSQSQSAAGPNSVGSHALSLFGRSAAQPPPASASGGGRGLGAAPGAAGSAAPGPGSTRHLSGLINGVLLNEDDLVALPQPLAPGAAAVGAGAAQPRAGGGVVDLSGSIAAVQQRTQSQSQSQSQQRMMLQPTPIRGFLSMRGSLMAKDTAGAAGAGASGSLAPSHEATQHQGRTTTASLERIMRPFTQHPAPAAAAPPSCRPQSGAAEASPVAAAAAAGPESDSDREEPTAAVGVIVAGGGDGGPLPDPAYLLSTATTCVEDLLSSLMDSVAQPGDPGASTRYPGGDMAAGAGPDGASRAGGGGGAGWMWQCDSILHVTGEDARELARQQMDMLVNSVTATGAESAAAARHGAGYYDDLAHLQLREVLGRGGGGVVLRGKSGTTDVAVKLMEMPIAPEQPPPPPGQQKQKQQPGPGQQGPGQGPGPSPQGRGEDASERDRMLLRNRRAMLRHAMELWCGTVLSHPNIVQVYTTFNSVVLKLRPGPDGGRQFYLQAVPEGRRLGQQGQPAGTAAGAAAAGGAAAAAAAAGSPGPAAAAAASAAPVAGAATAAAPGGEGEAKDALEPNDSICTAILVEWCDRGSLAAALYARTFPRIVPRHYDDVFRAMPYDMRDVYLTLLDIALALRHLHSLHLVHRDLKSANLLLKSNPSDPRGFTVKLADFGFVLQMTEVDQDGTRYVTVDQPAGTVTHMPPEALNKNPRVDASADVYGFGVIMWELLAGGLRPYSQVPVDRIPRLVVKGGRPIFPENVPLSYRRLASACWSALPSKRPRAVELVAAITGELAALG